MPDPTVPAGADDLRDRMGDALRIALRRWSALGIDDRGGLPLWTFLTVAAIEVRDEELERLRAELAALRTDETDVDWLADHVRTAVHYVLGRIEPRLHSKVRTEAAEQASIHIRAGSVPFVNARVMDLAIDLIKQAETERDEARRQRDHHKEVEEAALRAWESVKAERDALKAATERARKAAASFGWTVVGKLVLAALDTPTEEAGDD